MKSPVLTVPVLLTCLALVGRPCEAQLSREAVSPLPVPSGPNSVGTTVTYLTDSSRTADFASGRPITLQIWYPAGTDRGAVAPYLWESGLGAMLRRQEYYGVDSATISAWEMLRTHAVVEAGPLPGKHPLLAFSVGLGVARANYTSLAEELASNGYVVALVESPFQGTMRLPDGREIADTAGRFGEAAAHRSGVNGWARDIGFALDRIGAARSESALGRVAESIAWNQVGAAGHSTGGLVAVAACEMDRRIRACANLDGGVATPAMEPLADFVARGITKPMLLFRSRPLYDDSTFARRKMTRQEWEKRGEAGSRALEAFKARARAPLSTATVAGTGHFNFTDGPYVMPSSVTRFGGRIIDRDQGLRLITLVLRTYFDEALLAQGPGIGALAGRFPEIQVTLGARTATPKRP